MPVIFSLHSCGEVVEREAGVTGEGRRIGIGRVEAGEARRRQPVAQGHQLIDLVDDALLFGEGWEGDANGLSVRSKPENG